MSSQLLSGVRVIESSLLGPGFVGTFLADMGAEVIKVEAPTGDYIRQMTWPIVEGVSLLHLHTHRGKKSITLDLRSAEGVEIYKDLVRSADVVIEASRPGALAKRGLGFDDLRKVNPKIVFLTISGYGSTGPYKDLPAHGIVFDTWAGIVGPDHDDEGFARIPRNMPNVGINVGPMVGAMALLAGIIKARSTGEGVEIEVAQSDAAAYMDWYRIESYRAYQRPESEVTGNASDNYERRAPGLAGMWEGVRYQIYASSDGHVIFMASEQAFWKNFCEGIGRPDLFEAYPGSKYADHARGNIELQRELKAIFATKTSAEWLDFAEKFNTPIGPVNTPESIGDDPQFADRFGWLPASELGCDQMRLPVNVVGAERPPVPTKAPTVGQHTDQVMDGVLGYDADRIAELRAAGAFG